MYECMYIYIYTIIYIYTSISIYLFIYMYIYIYLSRIKTKQIISLNNKYFSSFQRLCQCKWNFIFLSKIKVTRQHKNYLKNIRIDYQEQNLIISLQKKIVKYINWTIKFLRNFWSKTLKLHHCYSLLLL